MHGNRKYPVTRPCFLSFFHLTLIVTDTPRIYFAYYRTDDVIWKSPMYYSSSEDRWRAVNAFQRLPKLSDLRSTSLWGGDEHVSKQEDGGHQTEGSYS